MITYRLKLLKNTQVNERKSKLAGFAFGTTLREYHLSKT